MNVYDFDNTILRGDSTARFFAWCLLRTPRLWLRVPAQAANALLFALRLRPKQAFKEHMLSFVTALQDVDAEVERFWDKNESRVKDWYRAAQRPDDVVISASPEFLIAPICARLGIRTAMGSPVDKRTGHYLGLNCHGQEKVVRFRAAFPEGGIDAFYSDSYSDDPLAQLARKRVLVKGEQLLDWDVNRPQRKKRRA